MTKLVNALDIPEHAIEFADKGQNVCCNGMRRRVHEPCRTP